MKKDNVVKLVAVAFVVAIISTGLFYGLFASRLSSAPSNGPLVVVAAKALKPGAVISQGDVKTVPWPSQAMPKEAYHALSEVVGSAVFDPIAENEPVLRTRLASSNTGGGLGVPEGMRAVSVHVSDSTGVMAMLRSGQKVDVQAVLGRGPNHPEASARTLLENLAVLSVIPQVEQSSQALNSPVVTLLATPQQADILAAADAGASVRLILRNPGDKSTRPRTALSLSAAMRAAE